MKAVVLAGLIGLTGTVAACEPAPVPIAYGEQTCSRCTMGIADTRFGAELVTTTGKIYAFDSVECLAAFYDEADDPGSVHSLWVTDFSSPGELIPAPDARYLVDSRLASPMGLSIVAFADDADEQTIAASFGGRLVGWEEIRLRVRKSGEPHGGHQSRESSLE